MRPSGLRAATFGCGTPGVSPRPPADAWEQCSCIRVSQGRLASGSQPTASTCQTESDSGGDQKGRMGPGRGRRRRARSLAGRGARYPSPDRLPARHDVGQGVRWVDVDGRHCRGVGCQGAHLGHRMPQRRGWKGSKVRPPPRGGFEARVVPSRRQHRCWRRQRSAREGTAPPATSSLPHRASQRNRLQMLPGARGHRTA